MEYEINRLSERYRGQAERESIDSIRQFAIALRRREVRGSYEVARQTALMIRKLLGSWPLESTKDAIQLLHHVGAVLSRAQPVEVSLGNIIRRVLYFIRVQYSETKYNAHHAQPTLQHLLSTPNEEEDYSLPFKRIKPEVLHDIQELKDDLDNIYHDITGRALEHIHSKEVIMTFGKSNTVVEFLKKAGSKRKFHVIVPESAPLLSGHITALKLAEAGIDTTLIPDSAIFAMMARVNKVIVGTHAVMANGGLVAQTGMNLLAQAAKHHSVPFVVIVGLYKLSPLYEDDFTDLISPGHILNFEEVDKICRSHQEGLEVQNPLVDFIPPELVSLFLTNSGGFDSSYIYRLLAEYYNMHDYTFQLLPPLDDQSQADGLSASGKKKRNRRSKSYSKQNPAANNNNNSNNSNSSNSGNSGNSNSGNNSNSSRNSSPSLSSGASSLTPSPAVSGSASLVSGVAALKLNPTKTASSQSTSSTDYDDEDGDETPNQGNAEDSEEDGDLNYNSDEADN